MMNHVFSRFWALLEVVVVAVAGSLITQLGFSFYGISPPQILGNSRVLFLFLVVEASITLVLITSFLQARGESFRSLGLAAANASREARIGIYAVPALFGATLAVGLFFRVFFSGYVSTRNPLLQLVENGSDLVLFMVSSIYVGGIKEEIQRAFVLVRFERRLGGVAVGLILWSVFFGFGHQMQGVDSAAGAAILGLLFGLLYVWRRNLLAPMISHALYDILTLIIFWNFLIH